MGRLITIPLAGSTSTLLTVLLEGSLQDREKVTRSTVGLVTVLLTRSTVRLIAVPLSLWTWRLITVLLTRSNGSLPLPRSTARPAIALPNLAVARSVAFSLGRGSCCALAATVLIYPWMVRVAAMASVCSVGWRILWLDPGWWLLVWLLHDGRLLRLICYGYED